MSDQTIGNASILTPAPRRIAGSNGERAFVGVFGEQRTAELQDMIGVIFEYGVDLYHDCEETKTGTGNWSRVGSTVQLASGASGTYALQSQDRIVYRPGHSTIAGFTMGLSNAPTKIQFVTRASGVDTKFDLNGSSLAGVDWTKIQVIQMSYGYFGGLPVKIQMMAPNTANYMDIHIQYTHNLYTRTNVGSPRCPIRMEATSAGVIRAGAFDVNDGIFLEFTTGVTGNQYIYSASWGGGVMWSGNDGFGLGRPFCYPQLNHVDRFTAIGTSITNLVTFRSKTQFAGRNNRLRSLMIDISWLATGNDLVTLFLIGNATFTTGVLTFADFNTTYSSVEIAERAAGGGGGNDLIVNGGNVGFRSMQFPQTGQGNVGNSFSSTSINSQALGLYLRPADGTYTVAAKIASGTATIALAVNWEEGV
jgi:hypothetical protein